MEMTKGFSRDQNLVPRGSLAGLKKPFSSQEFVKPLFRGFENRMPWLMSLCHVVPPKVVEVRAYGAV
jgi:hypothetical protein